VVFFDRRTLAFLPTLRRATGRILRPITNRQI